MTQPVSAVIPTYNRAATIGRAINSVLAQTYPVRELIIADDGSTDDTEHIMRACEDDRIVYHRMPVNGGAATARNAGVRLASSPLIAFLDSDDVWMPDKLEKQMAYLETHPDCKLVYCKFRYHENSDDDYGPFRDLDGRKMEGDIRLELLERNTIGTPTVLVNRESFLSCGGFDDTLRSLEDWEFAVRFAKDNPIGFVDETLVECFLDRSSGISYNNEEHFRVRMKMLKDHREFLEQNGKLEYLIAGLFSAAARVGASDFVKTCFQETFFPELSGR